MDKLFLKSLIFVSGLIFLISCDAYHVQRTLNDVESYIMERPDSALTVLDSMDRSCLTSERLKAHHALLHAMALDKNFIDVTDDSLASVAVSYFSRRGPEKYKARSLYYLGLSYYYAQDYDKAILEFTKAEKVAEKSDSLYWGMTKGVQANVYIKTYNDVEALKSLQRAYDIYTELSSDYYRSVTELKLAKSYFNLNEICRADSILQNLATKSGVHEDVKTAVLTDLAFINAVKSRPDYRYTVELYENIIHGEDVSFLTYKDYWAYTYALYGVGRSEEAEDIMLQLEETDSSGTAFYWKYMIEKSNNNHSSALMYLEKYTNKIDKEINDILKESLALSQRDYYKSQFELVEYKANNRKLTIISILVASVLILLLVSWGISVYVRRQREEKESYLKYADEIRRQLEAYKNEDYPELKRRYIELYKSKFEVIGSLYEQYTLFDGKKNAEHAIYERVSAILDDFRNDYGDTGRLESILNEDMDNIVASLRVEMPRFKEMDYSIFCFLLIGFDATTISHLLNTSINTVYIRKSRMKKNIEEANPVHKGQFLAILS